MKSVAKGCKILDHEYLYKKNIDLAKIVRYGNIKYMDIFYVSCLFFIFCQLINP